MIKKIYCLFVLALIILFINSLFVSCETNSSINISKPLKEQELDEKFSGFALSVVPDDIHPESSVSSFEKEKKTADGVGQNNDLLSNSMRMAQPDDEQKTNQSKQEYASYFEDNHSETTSRNNLKAERSFSIIPITLGIAILLVITFIAAFFKKRKGRNDINKLEEGHEENTTPIFDFANEDDPFIENEESQIDIESSAKHEEPPEPKTISITSSNSGEPIYYLNSQSVKNIKGKHFLCGNAYKFGDLAIDNPCVYLSDSEFSFAIKRSMIPDSISMNSKIMSIAEKSLNHRDLYFFDQDELSYYLLWLANYKEYDYIPPHCFSRFFDGIFHRALIERKDQLPIINKVLDMASCYPDSQLLVEFIRFVFAVLIDCEDLFDSKTKIDIANQMKGLFDFRFHYLKAGWDWDPISWYLDSKLENLIPNELIRKQKMASADVRTYYRGLLLTQRYMKCRALVKGEKKTLGTPVLSGAKTKRTIKSYHGEEFTYITNNWWIAGGDIEKEDPALYEKIDEYLHSDWHHTELVDSSDTDSDISMWLALPSDCQKDIAPLFEDIISTLDGKEMSIRELFKIFDKTYPNNAKSIWAIGDYYLKYIGRCMGYLGYSLVSLEPLERVCLSSDVWVVKTENVEQKRRELLDNNTEPLFTVNDKGRLVSISPKVFYFETVHIQSEIQGKRVKEIGPDVFSYAKMKNLIIDDGIRIIRSGAFIFCKNLEHVELPNSLIEIVGTAFAFCSSLRTITIPKNVRKMGNSVFSQCNNLEKIVFEGEKTVTG